MKVIFYDVEHGSCCHIITPKGKHILVDVGSKTESSIVAHINRKYFKGQGGKIDQLIITHPHEDRSEERRVGKECSCRWWRYH